MSIPVPLKGFGGGGANLNFKVVGNPKPTSPRENTIWIDTDEKITSWIFSATAPENPSDGMVWISTGTSRTVEFNALKKNGIQVYPLSAKQYVSGAWVDVTAMSYQGGEWVDWFLYLIKDSQILTGDWVAEARTQNASGAGSRKPTISITEGSIKFGYDSTSASGGIVRAPDKINLTGKNKLILLCDATGRDGNEFLKLNVWSEMGTYENTNCVATATIRTGSEQEIELDVSGLTGSYYIGFFIYTNTGVTPKDLCVG